MAKDGLITRKDIIEDQAMNIGPDYAKNMQEAIKANKELVASLKEMAPLVNTFRNVNSQQEFAKAKQQENIITLQAINANKLLEASEISLEKIKKAKLLTEKAELDVASKKEAITKRNTQLTVEERLQNEINNRVLKQEAKERLGLVGVYEKLNKARTDAKNKLRDLIANEKASTIEIERAQRAFDSLDAKVKKADKAVGDFSKNVGNYKSTLKGLGDIFSAFGFVGGITGAIALGKEIFNTTKELQSLDLALKSVTGSQENFKEQQSFLSVIANKYGLEIKDLTKQYTSFYVAAKDKLAANEIQDLFENISKSGSALGLSNETLGRSFTALNQMLSKGTVASEELRGQLAEALPGSVQAMVKAVQVLHPEIKNLTEKGLFEMIKSGKILASEVLPETARQLVILTGADKAERIDTLTKSTNRLSNEWTDFIKVLSESSTGDFFGKFFSTGIQMAGDFLSLLKNIAASQGQINQSIFDENKQRGSKQLRTEFQSQDNNTAAQKMEFLTLKSQGAANEVKRLTKELREAEAVKNKLFNKELVTDSELAKIQNIDNLKKAIGFQSGVNAAAKQAVAELRSGKPSTSIQAANDIIAQPRKTKLDDSAYQLEKQRLELAISINDQIAKDDEETDDLRLAALQERSAKEIALINLNKNREFAKNKETYDNAVNYAQAKMEADLSASKLTEEGKAKIKNEFKNEVLNAKDELLNANEKTKINEKYAYDKLQIEKKTADEIDKINEFDTKSFDDKIKRELNQIEIKNNDAVIEEEKRFQAELALGYKNDKEKENAAKRHEEELFRIKKEGLIKTTKLQIAVLNDEIDAYEAKAKKDGIITQKESDFISEKRKEVSDFSVRLIQAEGSTFKENEKEKTKSVKEQTAEILQISLDATDALGQLASAFSERKIQEVDDEINKSNEYYDKQIELAGNDIRQKELLEKERDKKLQVLEIKKRKEMTKQAEFEKALTVTKIALQTALAVITAAATTAPTFWAVAIATAIGAIQLGAALATPIPKYKMGRKGGPAELAVTGDGGVPEVVSRPDGSGALVTPNKPTLTFLQKDDIVHKSVADYNEYMRRSILKGFYKEKEKASTPQFINNTSDNSELLNELKRNTDAINKQKTNVQVTNKIDIGYEMWRLGNINWRK